ncbi:Restriction endonuclease subunit S [Vibrio chagasii]|nr:Restriction endonuclease subunit S [Vibrio chagasii]CAH6849197.1 Restriction endonuclease subunit S [Vibrio chagasii]CAH6854039.1 Restriction endonuclease subunit S [Vibrio chagasii]CAH7055828.1 Restriction endonuclease subunit S [Vibrio chagasii]CAH7095651.1 Restriction endonuclease subunit S [Vibrio chagasii]
MFFATASAGKLEQRLDAGFYNPKYLSQEDKFDLFNTMTIGEIAGDPKTVTYGVLKPIAGNSTCLLAKIQNFDNGFLDVDSCASINKQQFEQYLRSECFEGDLIVALGGYPGKACIIGELGTNVRININQHIARIRVKNEHVNSYYILSYLLSPFGKLSLERQITGSVQAGINLEDLRTLPVIVPSHSSQTYIGDKIRQAECLRAWAKTLQDTADLKIEQAFSYKLVDSMSTKPRKISSFLLSPDSLGPEFARAQEGQATFEASQELLHFIEFCKCGDPIKSEDRVAGEYHYYGASGPIDSHNEYNFDGDYLIVAQDGSIGCANVAHGKIWANNHVWVLKAKQNVDIDALGRFLDHHFPYWKGVTTGSVVPKVTSENLLKVNVPAEIAKSSEIGDHIRLSDTAVTFCKKLTQVARLLVENLIEGHISEQELIDAQQALESGNKDLDRALLARFSAKGIDVDGASPLFDDLDQLYSLLEQAELAQQEA